MSKSEFIDFSLLDPNLERKKVDGPAPEELGGFDLVIITVPQARNEVANTGDIHLKFIPKHYLEIADLVILVPDHYRRGDFSIPSLKKCAVSRHFFVRPESLGKKIVASVKILKNNNGLLSINVYEVLPIDKKDNEGKIIAYIPPPEFKMSMRPLKAGESEGPNLFFIPMVDKCLEFIPMKQRVNSFVPQGENNFIDIFNRLAEES